MEIEEFLKKYPHLRGIYEVLKDYLPSRITIMELDNPYLRLYFNTSSRILAIANKQDNLIAFKYLPPDPVTFAHELIHLCRKPDIIDEEVYGYNLAALVVMMAEEGIKSDPFCLFTLTEADINEVLQQHSIKSIDDFYRLYGIVPSTHTFTSSSRVERRNNVNERDIVVTFISELIAGASVGDRFSKEVITELLRKYCLRR